MKDLACEVDHSSLSHAKVENEWMELCLHSRLMVSWPAQGQLNLLLSVVQGDQKVSVNLMITVQSSGAQKLFDHSVVFL